jgi:hypothetical protein
MHNYTHAGQTLYHIWLIERFSTAESALIDAQHLLYFIIFRVFAALTISFNLISCPLNVMQQDMQQIRSKSLEVASSEKHFFITCKRGRPKHSVKDDHAFLWQYATFRHLPSRNPSTDQNEILND